MLESFLIKILDTLAVTKRFHPFNYNLSINSESINLANPVSILLILTILNLHKTRRGLTLTK